MKAIITKTLALLTGKEKRNLLFLLVTGAAISVADITFLAALIFIAGFYTRSGMAVRMPSWVPPAWLNPDSVRLALAFLILFVLKNMLAYLAGYKQYRFIYQVASRIAHANLLDYLQAGYDEYAATDSSVNIRKISQQPIEFCHYILTGLLEIFTEVMLITLTISAILWYNARLFLLLLVILLPGVLALAYFSKKKLKGARLNIKATGEKTLQHLQEALDGYVESNIYDKKMFFSSRYLRYQRLLNKYLSDLRIIQGLPSRFIEIFAVSGFFILVVIHNLYGNQTAVSLVTIGAFTVAVYKVIPGIAKILNINGQIHAYQFTIIDLCGSGGRPLPKETAHPAAEAIREILFHRVSFQYAHNKGLFKEMSFSAEAGEIVGITGASGMGKTTILHLLLGFLSPSSGTIQVNGAAADAAALARYRKDIAYARQHAYLIHDSMLKNITLEDTGYDERRLKEAVQATALDEWAARFADGLDHVISEDGKNISGGQRKRICIARALYKDAGLLILDEPFSELDESSSNSILVHLRRLAAQGKIILLITHATANLCFCDKIISLDENPTENADRPGARLSGT
jgi:ABC-type multidrug transport system fused ATPase/permease subunit